MAPNTPRGLRTYPAKAGAGAGDVSALSAEIDALDAASVKKGSLYVNVKDYGAVGDGVADDTDAIEDAFSDNPYVFFPQGTYLYNGSGVDLANFGIAGPHGGGARIILGASSYMFNRTGNCTGLTISNILFENGLGCFRSTYTSGNVFAKHYTVTDCTFKNFTICAVGHNSSDWPNWKIQRCFATTTTITAIGFALNGLSDNCKISDVGFGGSYRIGVKLARGGNNCKLENLDMTGGTLGTSNPATAEVWVVPSAANTNAGSGLVLEQIKFGNEHLRPGVDFRVLYADEDGASGSDFTTRKPALTTPSAGYIAGHQIRDCAVVGSSGSGNPLVYSLTSNVQGCSYTSIPISGASPSYILQFAPELLPLAPSRLNSMNVIGPVMFRTEDVGSGFAYCNVDGIVKIVDPVGAFQHMPGIATPYPGGGLGTSGVSIVSDAQASTLTASGASLSSATDALGGTDARQIVFNASGDSVNLPTISTSNYKQDQPLWIEFDLLNDGLSPVTDLAFNMYESTTEQHRLNVNVAANSAGWQRHRYQVVLRQTAANLTCYFKVGSSNALGTVKVGRIRLYHAREPVPLDIAHVGHYAGFFGATPVAKPTVTGTRADTAALTSLLSQLSALGLVSDSSTAGSLPSSPDETTLFAGRGLTTGEETMDRRWVGAVNYGLTNSKQVLVFFKARKTETINQVRVISGGTAASSTTHAVISIYSVDPSTGNGTLLASTADDVTIFAAANTAYTRTLDAAVSKVAGNTYALSFLVAATTPNTVPVANPFGGVNSAEVAQAPRLSGLLGSTVTAPAASFTGAGVQNISAVPYAVLLP